VEEVVERVARETMASVAERVIGKAIEALRASLESSSDES
jgi:histone H3/H4